jgi:ABC-type nitrate/sulfonate/bicarbonate transport system substrate-binding protein
MPLRRFAYAAAVSIAAALVFRAPACAEKLSINVASLAASFGPLFAALDKGYFAEEGFEAELPLMGGGTAIPALIGGSLVYSGSPSSAMSAILKGAPLTIILAASTRPTYQLWSFDPDVTRFDQLKGRTVVVVARGATEEMALRMLLKARGLPSDYVGYTPLGAGAVRLAAVTSGSQKLIFLTRGERGALNDSGTLAKGTMLIDFAKDVELQTGGLVTTSAELAAHRDRAKRVVRAYWKGTLYMKHEPEGMTDILQKRVPNFSREAVKADVLGAIEDADDDGELTPDSAKRELAVRGEVLGMAPEKVPGPDKVYDFSVIAEVIAELKAQGWTPTR